MLKSLMERMKQIAATFALIVLIAGFGIDTGSAGIDADAIVFVDVDSEIMYPPHRAPNWPSVIPISYEVARSEFEATKDNSSGWATDGPPLLIDLAVTFGMLKSWPSYWHGTNVKIRSYSEYVKERYHRGVL